MASKISFSVMNAKPAAPPVGKLTGTPMMDDEPEHEEENEVMVNSVDSVTARSLTAIPKKKKESIVIPLINQNQWIAPESGDDNKLQQLAVQELIDTARGVGKEEAQVEAIPLLVQNKVPGIDEIEDEDDKFRLDVSLRPSEPTLDTYSKVPIEQFGKGLLMGMGWKEGGAIGLSNKQVVKPIEYLKRGHRLGLGATEMKQEPPEHRKKPIPKPGEVDDQKPLVRTVPDKDGRIHHFRSLDDRVIPLKATEAQVNGLVEIIAGPHKRLYGQIQSIAEGSCAVKLNLNGEVVEVLRQALQVLDEHALPTDHPAFTVQPKKRKQIEKSRSPSASAPKKHKPHKHKLEKATWVQPRLRVTVTSRSLHTGKYYSKKAIVLDVVDPYTLTLQMVDSAEIVENVNQRHICTVVPKEGQKVMIVCGAHKNQIGSIHSKDKRKQQVGVFVEGDAETLSFDAVCDFVSF